MTNLSRPIAALLIAISTPPLLAADATRMLNERAKTAVDQLNTW